MSIFSLFKQSLLSAIKTNVQILDPENSRNESSKSTNETFYDRYEKYHYKSGEMSKLDKVLDKTITIVIDKMKKVIKNDN